MNKRAIRNALRSLCLLAILSAVSNTYALDREGNDEELKSGETKPLYFLAQTASNQAEAASIAKSRHGGKVLSVQKSGNGWQVKLLLDSGRVKLVYVGGKTNT